MDAPFQLIRRVLPRLITGAVVLALALAVGGLGLLLRDKDAFEQSRQERMQSLTAERAKVQAGLVEVRHRLDATTAAITTEQERIRQTDGVIAELKNLDSTWDRLTGDAQQRSNRDRREKLEQSRTAATAQVAALQQEFARTTWERDGLEIDLGKLDAQLRRVAANRSKFRHYLGQAWNDPLGGLKIKWWLAIFLGLYSLAPIASLSAADRARKL